MTFGELLHDFCRVGLLDAGDRWVAQVINTRLADYLARATVKYRLEWAIEPQEAMLLTRDAVAGLPRTALAAIGETPWRLPVRATCIARAPVTEQLTRFAHRVDAPGADSRAEAVVAAPHQSVAHSTGELTRVVGGERPNARAAILTAIDELTSSRGVGTVTPSEVVAHLKAVGSPYADSTIRTMMTSHMCVDAQGPGIGTYDDLERLGRGEYRRRSQRP